MIMEENKMAEANKDEQVGFHKGALSTLAKEREEMMKILQIVEQLMQMHVKALKEWGVDLEAMAKKQVKDKSLEKSL
jgi:thiaminase